MFSQFLSFCPRGVGVGGWGDGGWGMGWWGGGGHAHGGRVVLSQKVLMPRGGGGSPTKKCSYPQGERGVLSQKVLMPGRGVLSQKVLMPGGGGVRGTLEVNIIHDCLHVISLLTCCQQSEPACTCLYSHAVRHSGKLPPSPPGMRTFCGRTPPPSSGHEDFMAEDTSSPRPRGWALCPPSDIGTTYVCGKQSGTTYVCGKQSRFEVPSCLDLFFICILLTKLNHFAEVVSEDFCVFRPLAGFSNGLVYNKVNTVPIRPSFYKLTGSGSRNFWRGGPGNMKYKPHTAAIFFMTNYYRAGGSCPPPPRIRYWINNICIYLSSFIFSPQCSSCLDLHL